MKIFSADGGGYLGLATAAFIEETERHFNCSFSDTFDLFCGTSTGAIIALALASGKKGSEIVRLYQELGTTVFHNPHTWNRTLRKVKSFLWPMYSREPLDAALKTAFEDLTLGQLLSNGKRVIIPAFSITKGRPRVFKTDHASDLTLDNERLVRDVAGASASAPIYFAPVRLVCPSKGTNELFCDGGLFANHPALLGITEAVSHLGVPLSDVSVLLFFLFLRAHI